MDRKRLIVQVLAAIVLYAVSGRSEAIMREAAEGARLARQPAAFIRPTPSHGDLGGGARCTRETISSRNA